MGVRRLTKQDLSAYGGKTNLVSVGMEARPPLNAAAAHLLDRLLELPDGVVSCGSKHQVGVGEKVLLKVSIVIASENSCHSENKISVNVFLSRENKRREKGLTSAWL